VVGEPLDTVRVGEDPHRHHVRQRELVALTVVGGRGSDDGARDEESRDTEDDHAAQLTVADGHDHDRHERARADGSEEPQMGVTACPPRGRSRPEGDRPREVLLLDEAQPARDDEGGRRERE
jgi:hypothetical protein